MRETWYVLEDGTPANPREVSRDETGALRHVSGIAVAIGPYGPKSTGVDLDDVKLFAGKGDHDGNGKTGGAVTPDSKPKDMQAAKPAQGYKTRQTRTRR